MAFPHPPGLTPPEIAFICEMEHVTIVPRQRLERLDLLGVSGPAPGLCTIERWEHTRDMYKCLLMLFSSGPHSRAHSATTFSPASMASSSSQAPATGEYYTTTMAAP
jgi:hypothetical protein